jgi:alpha-glutamyl/putrescinyl thymine pyrophosphorylase clade 1
MGSMKDVPGVTAFFEFIKERHAIYVRKSRGDPWPWTADPILQQYRFCNVYRNLDRESILIHQNWLQPHTKDEDVWFAMVVARLVNWWPTLQCMPYPVPWRPDMFKDALNGRKARGEKVFTGAYMVRADAVVSGSKADYLADYVLSPMWEARALIRPRHNDMLREFHQRLTQYRDMGSFMAAQVVADVKYADGPLLKAKDWDNWAAPGPGSLRGLNVVLGSDPHRPWAPGTWEVQFQLLQSVMRPKVKAAKLSFITGQDLQNCLCEFSKYSRGYGKARYKPPRA